MNGWGQTAVGCKCKLAFCDITNKLIGTHCFFATLCPYTDRMVCGIKGMFLNFNYVYILHLISEIQLSLLWTISIGTVLFWTVCEAVFDFNENKFWYVHDHIHCYMRQ